MARHQRRGVTGTRLGLAVLQRCMNDSALHGLDQDAQRRLAWLRRAAWLLDGAARVPGTRFRFGLNSLIGLVPGGGDTALAVMSLIIVWQARKLGAPAPLVRRMLANVAIEFGGGLVPIVGDLFDMGFKANLRNLALLEQHLVGRRGPAR